MFAKAKKHVVPQNILNSRVLVSSRVNNKMFFITLRYCATRQVASNGYGYSYVALVWAALAMHDGQIIPVHTAFREQRAHCSSRG
jgi:hypothetical protein